MKGTLAIMRFLFTTTPGFSHTVPLVPLAHAARLAGHQVLFAAGGPALRAAAEAGLATVDVTSGQDVTAPYIRLTSTAIGPELPVPEVMRRVFGAFGEIGDLMLPALTRTARDWEADVVLYPPMLPAGVLAARAAGSLAVVHGIGLRHPLFPLGADADAAEPPSRPDAELSLGPGSLEEINPSAPADVPPYGLVTMRPCTYNGGGPVPAWALKPVPGRPRVLVTLGSVPAHNDSQADLLKEVIKGAETLDAEVVVTSGGSNLRSLLGEVPDHVRLLADFLPLSAVLPTCTAVVHHGGMSTMFAALTAAVPQVIVPTTKGDALTNSQVVEGRGVGLAVDPADCTAATAAEAIRRVVHEPGFRTVSEDVAAELTAMPDPGEAVGRLADLVRAHRG